MRITFLICLSFIYISCLGQDSKIQDSLKNIEQLDFMKGTWKGEGWIYVNKERKEFTQTETIASKAENTVLVIDGIGYAKDSISRVIHNAFGVISYNQKERSITMISFSSTGGKMENKMKLIGYKKLEWSFKDERGGTIRFQEDFSEDGIWSEKGEYSSDGQKWLQFFEMRLTKQGE